MMFLSKNQKGSDPFNPMLIGEFLMNFKKYIPIVILFSAFLFGFIFTSLIFKDEIKGMLLSDYVEYVTTEGLITKSSTKLPAGLYTSSMAIDVWYAYEVNSIVYASNLITFAADYYDVDYYLEKYPLKKRVTIYYQKDNPSFAVLEPDKKNWFVVFRPFIWVLAGGLIFLLFYLRTKLKWLDDLMEWLDEVRR